VKYAIIIPDGAADDPVEDLGGKTPLEVAHTPHLDWISTHGRQGIVRTVPAGFESGSDVAIMTLLGYDPRVYHTGRAPLEAAALNIPLTADDWVFRCNLVTVVDGVMKDHSAGGITDAEARALLSVLRDDLKHPNLEFHFGVSYRNLLVHRGGNFKLKTTPPHDIPEQAIAGFLPTGESSDLLRRVMDRSAELFAGHEINQVRVETGLNPATQAWIWGQGKAPKFERFVDRFGISRGAMITGVDLLRGLACLLGWTNLHVPGMTSFHDTDYAGQGAATADALDSFDLVVSHIEAPDEASHQADTSTKVASIESIDRHIVGPVLEKLRSFPEWRILVLPDHPTNLATRRHGEAPPPFCMAGTRVPQVRPAAWNEANAASSGLKIDPGHELMEFFLRSGN
jgi:2,3-bisphosphoglycerate-independent phosphoglycerate mutase